VTKVSDLKVAYYKSTMFTVIVWCGKNTACVAVECDPYCTSGCSTRGTGKCDQSCANGYSLNTTFYTCMGELHPLTDCVSEMASCVFNTTEYSVSSDCSSQFFQDVFCVDNKVELDLE